MKIEHAIKHFEEMVKEELEEAQDCLEVHDMENAKECEKCAEDHNQVANWLRQLQAIQRIITEYRSVPTQVMDSEDAFNLICEVVDENK